MVIGLTAMALSIRDRDVRWLSRLRPLPGIPIMLAVALPWLIAITISSHGAFITQSLGGDMAAKLAGAKESHGAPPGAYLAMFPNHLLAWIALCPACLAVGLAQSL